jgi:hypothetical protein
MGKNGYTRAMTPDERIRSRLKTSARKFEGTPCIEWTGHVTGSEGKKYGAAMVNGKTVRAHRWLYEQENGPVPPDLDVDHRCQNKLCCNLLHLEAVTKSINFRRALEVHRSNTCPNGHPYTGTNLRITTNGHRRCRECHNENQRHRRQAKSSTA